MCLIKLSILTVDDIRAKSPMMVKKIEGGPPTPHRIELCPDELKIEPKPKAKKRYIFF